MKLCLRKSSGLLFVLLFLARAVVAQHGQEKININTSTSDITSLAKSISAQTGLKYSLNMQNTSLRKKITIRPGNYPLARVLEQIKKQAALQYKIVGTHILFIDYSVGHGVESQNTKVKSQKKGASLSAKPAAFKKQSSYSAKPSTSRQLTELSRPLEPAGNIVTTAAAAALLPGSSSSAAIAQLLMADTIHGMQTSVPGQKATAAGFAPAAPVQPVAKPNRNNKWLHPAVKAGFGSDELFYAGAQVHAGLQWLYGIAAYGTNFNTYHFRWGGGISLPFTEKQRLHLTFTTGNASGYYVRDSIFKKDVWVKENLHRLGLAWSSNFNKHLSMQVQVHYNMLQQSFSADSSGVATDTPFKGDFDKRYNIFKPPYTLHQSVSTTSASKTWLGIQVSFFYIFL